MHAAAIRDDYAPYARAWALYDLAPHLSADQLDRALNAPAAINDDSGRAQALTALALQLPTGQRPAMLVQALNAAVAASRDFYDCGRTLTALAPYLSADQLDRALNAAAVINEDSDRAQTLTALALLLPADQQPAILAQAVDAVTAIRDYGFDRGQTLTALVPYLPAEQQPAILAQALDRAAAIRDDYDRALALTALALLLPADEQPAILAQALDAAAAIRSDSGRAEALADLVPHLPDDQLARAVSIATVIRDSQSMILFLRSSEVISAVAENGNFPQLLRSSLNGADRASCLSIITYAAQEIAKGGGDSAVQECVKSIADVTLWWQ